jgi:hypothetical protein
MNNLYRAFLNALVGLSVVAGIGSAIALAIMLGGRAAYAGNDGIVLDFNEQTHLEFMREEEKLARDVYMELGAMYPRHPIFGKIDDSEQKHTDAVRDNINKYGLQIPAPVTTSACSPEKIMAGTLPRNFICG